MDAGGLLLDAPLEARPRVAVIHRSTHGDYSLPKGHVEGDETLEEAAARELREETGYDADCLGIAGAIAYPRDGHTKSVTFFYFLRRTAEPTDSEQDGVDRVEWMTFERAREVVSYDEQAELLRRADPGADRWEPDRLRPGQSGLPRWWWRTRLRWDPRRDRLDAAIELFERELGALRRRADGERSVRTPGGSREEGSAWWRTSADELLALARTMSTEGRVDAAWEALHSSQRLSFHELDPQEQLVREEILRHEIERKLEGWRREAALKTLDVPENGAHALIRAQELLDQHNNNVYLKLRLAGRRLIAAATVLGLTLLGLGLAVYFEAFGDVSPGAGLFVLHDVGLFVGALILGVFGAMLSLVLDLSGSSPANNRIYELATARWSALVARLFIGAGSAVLAVAAVQAVIVGGDQPWLYLAAIPAGFSERLVRRAVDALGQNLMK